MKFLKRLLWLSFSPSNFFCISLLLSINISLFASLSKLYTFCVCNLLFVIEFNALFFVVTVFLIPKLWTAAASPNEESMYKCYLIFPSISIFKSSIFIFPFDILLLNLLPLPCALFDLFDVLLYLKEPAVLLLF